MFEKERLKARSKSRLKFSAQKQRALRAKWKWEKDGYVSDKSLADVKAFLHARTREPAHNSKRFKRRIATNAEIRWDEIVKEMTFALFLKRGEKMGDFYVDEWLVPLSRKEKATFVPIIMDMLNNKKSESEGFLFMRKEKALRNHTIVPIALLKGTTHKDEDRPVFCAYKESDVK